MMSYRSAVHDSTKCTPAELMLGHNLRVPADLIFGHPPGTHPECSSSRELYANKLQEHLDTVHEFARTNIQSASNKMKHYYDRRSDQTKFSHGEAVWLYNPKRKKGISPKFSRPWECPYLVTEQRNDLLYKIQKSPHAKERIIHRNRLWKYQGNNVQSWLQPLTAPMAEAPEQENRPELQIKKNSEPLPGHRWLDHGREQRQMGSINQKPKNGQPGRERLLP